MLSDHNQSRAIRQKPLGQVIADELRRRIWQGELQFAERLFEAELSNEMEISRSSLREALQILEYEGLVVNKARKGTFVAEFTEADIQEINELRMHIEVPALMMTTEKIEEGQIAVLEEILQEMKQHLQSEDWCSLFDADMAFHLYLVDLCGNSRIVRHYRLIQSQIRTVISQLCSYYTNNKKEFYEEHEELLEAVKTRNPSEVQKVAISHIHQVHKQITNIQ